jgi:hypothetical protein
MSGESLPSVCYAVPCFELFMTAWEKLAKKTPFGTIHCSGPRMGHKILQAYGQYTRLHCRYV